MIRLYGSSIGGGSFARVSQGMRSALADLDQLEGFVPVDAYDEEAVYPGATADIGVFVGLPVSVTMMQSIGWHKERFALLPANSSWMPQKLVDGMSESLTGFIAPSVWAAEVLRKHTQRLVTVWQHGVHHGFLPSFMSYLAQAEFFEKGHFHVLHMTSTNRERKGTRELLLGWRQAVQQGLLGSKPELHVVADHSASITCPDFPKRHRDVGEVPNVYWNHRVNSSVVETAKLYRRYHLIAQPSRGEGFGMVPLEARACGVPVLMTDRTGHEEHVYAPRHVPRRVPGPGVQLVSMHEDAPIDDGPGAMAPELRVEDVTSALAEAYANWSSLAEAAHNNAWNVHEQWNWKTVTKRWLDAR